MGVPPVAAATGRVTTSPVPTGPLRTPRPSRVSIRRFGATGTNLAPLTSASTLTARLVETLPFAAVARTRTSSVTTAVALRADASVTATATPSTSTSNLLSWPLTVLVVQSTVRAAPLE